MQLALALVLLIATIGMAVFMLFTIRDTIGQRGSGTRRDGLVFQQRLSLLGLVSAPVVLLSVALLDMDIGRLWWILSLVPIHLAILIWSTTHLRRDDNQDA